MGTAATGSMPDETKNGFVVRGERVRKTLSLQGIGTRIGSRSFSSDTTNLPNRSTRTPPARTLP